MIRNLVYKYDHTTATVAPLNGSPCLGNISDDDMKLKAYKRYDN